MGGDDGVKALELDIGSTFSEFGVRAILKAREHVALTSVGANQKINHGENQLALESSCGHQGREVQPQSFASAEFR